MSRHFPVVDLRPFGILRFIVILCLLDLACMRSES